MTYVEIRHRVERLGNKVNLLVFRYLWPANLKDRADAWDGLVKCCWRAKGDLFAPREPDEPEPIERAPMRHLAAVTLEFLEGELRAWLAARRKLPLPEIARRALGGDFRWAARDVRNRLADAIRKTYRNRNRLLALEAMVEGLAEVSANGEREKQAAAIQAILAGSDALIAALGERGYKVLAALACCCPFDRIKRRRKRAATKVIARVFGVSERYARAIKSGLALTIAESWHPAVVTLRVSPLAKPVLEAIGLSVPFQTRSRE